MVEAIETAVASSSAEIEAGASAILPDLFVIFAGLVVLALVLRLFRRLVGKRA